MILLIARPYLINAALVAGLLVATHRTTSCGDTTPQDPYEPNNSQAEATAITLDFIAAAPTLTMGDEDWYKFTLQETMGVIIEAEMVDQASAFKELEVAIIKPDGTVFDSYSQNSYLTIGDPLSAGTWYVRVRGEFSEDATLQYDLTITDEVLNDDEFEENDTMGSAAPIQLNFFRDDLCLAYEESDWFQFNIAQQSFMFFEVQADDYIELSLLGANGARITGTFYNTADSFSTSFEWLLDAGKYYIEVAPWYDYEEPRRQDKYGLHVWTDPELQDDAWEDNDTMSQACVIALDLIEEPLEFFVPDYDFFTFSIPDPATVTFIVDPISPSLFSTQLVLYDKDGKYIISRYASGGQSINLNASLSAGKYYTSLYGSPYGEYLLSILAGQSLNR